MSQDQSNQNGGGGAGFNALLVDSTDGSDMGRAICSAIGAQFEDAFGGVSPSEHSPPP